jgi:sugar O-acyltransferase (sialic acid O-acetyltransferase NeuD family)
MNHLVIVGAGGLGREVLQYAREAFAGQYEIKGFLDDNPKELEQRGYDLGVSILGDTHTYYPEAQDRFLVAIGDPKLRQKLVERLSEHGAQFATLIHPKAYIAPSATIAVGCIISPFATVATFTKLEPHVVLGFYAHVGHDSQVGIYGVLSPYAAVNGGVVLEKRVFLGTHATVTPGLTIGEDVQIAAGSVVYQHVPSHRLVVGNPGKIGPKF